MSEETNQQTRQEAHEINTECLNKALKLARDLSDKYLVDPYFDKRTMTMAPLLGAVAHDSYKECVSRQR